MGPRSANPHTSTSGATDMAEQPLNPKPPSPSSGTPQPAEKEPAGKIVAGSPGDPAGWTLQLARAREALFGRGEAA